MGEQAHKKKATGLACGLVISKRLHARLPWLHLQGAASQECGCCIHNFNIMMFYAVRQKVFS
jgi:hypothetical protein